MEPYDFSDPSKKPASMSSREWLWLKEGKKCHWCGKPTLLIRVQQLNQATNDHVIPRGLGGSDKYDNVVSACHCCNQRRNTESGKGLPEGALMGTYTVTVSPPKPLLVSVKAKPKSTSNVTNETLLREQRDQAHTEIKRLRLQLSEAVWSHTESSKQLRGMTFRRLALMKLKAWVDRQKFSNGPVA